MEIPRMKLALTLLVLLALPVTLAASTTGASRPSLYPAVRSYIEQRVAEFGEIPADRRRDLERVAAYVSAQRDAGRPAQLTFVCTHNSRRSHMGMIWFATAAAHYGLDHVMTFSGGTETTAFNPRAVAAIERAGLIVERTNEAANPIYHVRFADDAPPLTCFSKVYDQAPNPRAGYAAVMVCDSADKACPNVPGADRRLAVKYVDPKVSDGTKLEAATYDERCAQIAREMLYAASRVTR
jgi:arsenate reductase